MDALRGIAKRQLFNINPMITSFKELTVNQYKAIRAISTDEGREEVDKQMEVLSILTGQSVSEIGHLLIWEYRDLVQKADFLSKPYEPGGEPKGEYKVGKFTLVPCKDFRKLETAQYIDFQTYAQDLEKYIVEMLSVILVPKGCRYNEGYDMDEVQKAIGEMSAEDAFTLSAFFIIWSKESIVNSLDYCRKEAQKIKDRRTREMYQKEIRRIARTISAKSGGGSQR